MLIETHITLIETDITFVCHYLGFSRTSYNFPRL